jgi:hypothetical protein
MILLRIGAGASDLPYVDTTLYEKVGTPPVIQSEDNPTHVFAAILITRLEENRNYLHALFNNTKEVAYPLL